MTKIIISSISFLFLFFTLNHVHGQSQSTEQFISLVLEVESNAKTQETDVKIVSARTVQARLKTPTKSEKSIKDLKNQDLIVRFLSDKDKVQREIIFNNPFLSDYEYVNDADQLEKVKVPEKKKAYFIRIPYQEELTTIQVFRKENSGEKLLFQNPIF